MKKKNHFKQILTATTLALFCLTAFSGLFPSNPALPPAIGSETTINENIEPGIQPLNDWLDEDAKIK